MIDDEGPKHPTGRRFFRQLRSVEVIVSLIAGVLAILAAFGIAKGSDDFAPPPSPRTSVDPGRPDKASYIATVDAICRPYNLQNDEILIRTGSASPRYASEASSLYDKMTTEWAEVVRPIGDEVVIQKMIDLLQRRNFYIREKIRMNQLSDARGVSAASAEAVSVYNEYAKLAQLYGYKQCGNPKIY